MKGQCFYNQNGMAAYAIVLALSVGVLAFTGAVRYATLRTQNLVLSVQDLSKAEIILKNEMTRAQRALESGTINATQFQNLSNEWIVVQGTDSLGLPMTPGSAKLSFPGTIAVTEQKGFSTASALRYEGQNANGEGRFILETRVYAPDRNDFIFGRKSVSIPEGSPSCTFCLANFSSGNIATYGENFSDTATLQEGYWTLGGPPVGCGPTDPTDPKTGTGGSTSRSGDGHNYLAATGVNCGSVWVPPVTQTTSYTVNFGQLDTRVVTQCDATTLGNLWDKNVPIHQICKCLKTSASYAIQNVSHNQLDFPSASQTTSSAFSGGTFSFGQCTTLDSSVQAANEFKADIAISNVPGKMIIGASAASGTTPPENFSIMNPPTDNDTEHGRIFGQSNLGHMRAIFEKLSHYAAWDPVKDQYTHGYAMPTFSFSGGSVPLQIRDHTSAHTHIGLQTQGTTFSGPISTPMIVYLNKSFDFTVPIKGYVNFVIKGPPPPAPGNPDPLPVVVKFKQPVAIVGTIIADDYTRVIFEQDSRVLGGADSGPIYFIANTVNKGPQMYATANTIFGHYEKGPSISTLAQWLNQTKLLHYAQNVGGYQNELFQIGNVSRALKPRWEIP